MHKSFMATVVRPVVVIGALLGAHQVPFAHDLPTDDAMTAAPQDHRVLLENESVRMLETRIRSGQRTAVHSHPWPSALYVITWSDFVRYDPDGKVLVDSINMATKPQPGAALWSPPIPSHYILNVGSTELLVISVELKRP